MKNRIIGILSFIFAGAFTCFLLVTAGYWYLDNSVKLTEQTVSDVPYTFAQPENKGIMFMVGGNRIFFYLDFEGEALNVVYPPENAETAEMLYGYPIDYTVEADNTLLTELIDALGGIEMEINGETLRYTGIQVKEVLERTPDTNGEQKAAILHSLLDRMAEVGLSSSDLQNMIEMSDTNLTVPDCYHWTEHIAELCRHVHFINEFGN